MSALETYLKAIEGTRGLDHSRAIATLRWYIRTSKQDDIITAIRQLSSLEHLRYLMEAGLNAELQKNVLKQHDKLTKGGGE